MSIDVFTKYGCPPCKLLKMWLNKNGIAYNEKPLEIEKNMNEFIERKGSGYPLIVIKEADEEKVFLGNTPKLKKYLREKYTSK
ncbi:glutaredoxin family protein [Shouchella lehensis]|uniref:Glutaredoxin domain-containing protein n=1 Tax=Shouchella lehensis TaxID=300825 RepID=A0A4Y7WLY0_9BACI|nr:glutaredoxin domain-containing protein [Shouchella lehensis]MBG9783129.1 hypothetical protein [Shouchella lehensis]TES49510.1 hypothetical protein E2L03_08560 [Shouchella lehensis]